MTPAERRPLIDAVRGALALYVAISHVLRHQLPDDSTWMVWTAFGQEAVIGFFLLSGCVIRLSFVSAGRPMDWRFLARRWVRLWPIIVLGLLTGYATSAVAAGAWLPPHWKDLAGNLLFLQDFSPVKPGTVCETYYGNATLWSLSYEWWFYTLYFVVMKWVVPAKRMQVVGAASLVAAVVLMARPNAAAYWITYFIIWWTGGALALADDREVRRALGWLVATLGVLVAGGLAWQRIRLGAPHPGAFPLLVVRHFGFAVVLAAAIRAMGLFRTERGFPGMAIFAWAAPMSYGLYVLHYPLATDAKWLAGLGVRPGWMAVIVYGGCAFVAAWWVEERLQPRVAGALGRWFGLGRRRNWPEQGQGGPRANPLGGPS